MGNPDAESTCGQLATAYENGARASGHEVRRTNLSNITFDPILHKGYKVIQELEPDLKKFQEDIRWADHFVLLYPTWWSSMPALLKGLFDRVWLPGFAFHFHPHLGWDKLLKGKTGRVVVTMDSWPMVSRILFGDSTNEIGRAILGFSGIHPIRIKKIGNVKHLSDDDKKQWYQKVHTWGQKAK